MTDTRKTALSDAEEAEAIALETLNKELRDLGYSVATLAASVPTDMLYGWTAQKLWDWFMPPSVPRIGVAQAIGLSMLVSFTLPQPRLNKTWKEIKEETDKRDARTMYQPVVNRALFCVGVLGIASVVKRFVR